MIIKAPDTVGTGGLQGIGSDQASHEFKIAKEERDFTLESKPKCSIASRKDSHGSMIPRTIALSSTPESALGNPLSFHTPARKARKLSSCPVP